MDNEIWIPVIFLIGLSVVLTTFFYWRYRSRSDLQDTVRQAIDKGQELTPELMQRLGASARTSEDDLRRGVIGVTVGVAFAVFGLMLGQPDAIRPLSAVGSFPFLIGVAYLGLWRFSSQTR